MKPFASIPNWLITGLAVISLIGFVDATYLTIEHYRGETPNCSLLNGCDIVVTSQYATVAGIPVALGGSIYYLTVLLLIIAYFDTKKTNLLIFIPPLTTLAFLATLWFVYAQLILIKALCLYCLGSAVTSTILFILGIILAKIIKRQPS